MLPKVPQRSGAVPPISGERLRLAESLASCGGEAEEGEDLGLFPPWTLAFLFTRYIISSESIPARRHITITVDEDEDV